jgi:uncharacterized protein GlcG (DUF336 family)
MGQGAVRVRVNSGFLPAAALLYIIVVVVVDGGVGVVVVFGGASFVDQSRLLGTVGVGGRSSG